MKPSEHFELEAVKDAFRIHFRTDSARPMRATSNGHRSIEVDIAHVNALVDVHAKSVFGNGAHAVYNLDHFLRAAAVIRDAYPDRELFIAFSDDDHWPCVIRAKDGQYGVAVAPLTPNDGEVSQSGIALLPPDDLDLKPGEEEF